MNFDDGVPPHPPPPRSFGDLFDLNFASITEAVDRSRRQEAVDCARGVLEVVLEAALIQARAVPPQPEQQQPPVLPPIEVALQSLQSVLDLAISEGGQKDKKKVPSAETFSSSSDSDDDKNVVIINVDSVVVRRDDKSKPDSDKQGDTVNMAGGAIAKDNANPAAVEVVAAVGCDDGVQKESPSETPVAVQPRHDDGEKDSHVVNEELRGEQEQEVVVEDPERESLSSLSSSALLDSALSIPELAVDNDDFSPGQNEESGGPPSVSGSVDSVEILSKEWIESQVRPTVISEEIDLTCDSDSRSSGRLSSAAVNDVNQDMTGDIVMPSLSNEESIGLDDPLDMDPTQTIGGTLGTGGGGSSGDRPSTRQVATVHPFGATPDAAEDEETQLQHSNMADLGETTTVAAAAAATTTAKPAAPPPTPPRSILRLRNFAVDPANAEQNQSSNQQQQVSNNSWHMAEGVASTAATTQEERVTNFSNAIASMRVTCTIGTREGQNARYVIVSSDKNIFLKLFIPESKIGSMPTTTEGWTDVAYAFFPNGHLPNLIRLNFQNFGQTQLAAKLPTSDAEVSSLVDQQETFVLSMVRVKRLDAEVRAKMERSFVRFAVKKDQPQPFVINVTDTAIELEPLYHHLDRLPPSFLLLSTEMRNKTREHLSVAIYFVGGGHVSGAELENQMYQQSRGNAVLYRNFIPRNLFPPASARLVPASAQHVVVAPNSRARLPTVTLLPPRVIANNETTVTPVIHQTIQPQQQQQQQQQQPPASTPFFYISHPPLLLQQQQQPQQQQPRIVLQQQQQQAHVAVSAAGISTSSCPFCHLPFSIRSDAFFQHVAIFHFPPLNDKQTCDVDNCRVAFTTRTGHVQHVSSHTTHDDSIFIMGLHRLLDYLCDPYVKKDVVGANDPRMHKATVCFLCKNPYKNMTDFFHHLTLSHFQEEITKNVPNVAAIKCKFCKCEEDMDSLESYVFHLGVRHQISYRLLKEQGHFNRQQQQQQQQTEQAPWEKTVPCPLAKCTVANLAGLPNVILHLISAHFFTPLKFEVTKLQRVMGSGGGPGKCPVEGCSWSISQRNALDGSKDGVAAAVVEHYSVAHSAVIDLLYRYSTEEGSLKPGVNVAAMDQYRFSVTKTPAYVCQICSQNNKRIRYGSNIAHLMHLSMAHYSKQLLAMFSAYFEMGGANVGRCSRCNLVIEPTDRALHVGMFHRKANDLLAEFLKDKVVTVVDAPPNNSNKPVPLPPLPKRQAHQVIQQPAGNQRLASTTEQEVITLVDDTPHPNHHTSQPAAAAGAAAASTSASGCGESYFGCPRCPAKFPVTSAELKVSTEKLLVKHLVSLHCSDQLKEKLKLSTPYCPVGQCAVRSPDLDVMSEHVQINHQTYVLFFLQKELKVTSVSKFFVEGRKSSENGVGNFIDEHNDDEVKDPSIRRLFEDYKKYCQDKCQRIDNCDANSFAVFLHRVAASKVESLAAVESFIKKVDEMHEGRLAKTTIVAKALGVLRSQMAPPPKPAASRSSEANNSNGGGGAGGGANNREGDDEEDLKRLYACNKCSKTFLVLSDLVNHISSPTHIGATVGCRYCRFYVKVESKTDSRRTLIKTFHLHSYGRSHLFNRRLFLQRKAAKEQQNLVRPTDAALVNFCEPCFERVEDLDAHREKKQHADKMRVINDFVDYCDKRDICPVTCLEKDVNFHMEVCCSKQQMEIGINQVLLILSRLHEPIDGVELCGIKSVEDKIQELMSRSFSGKQVFYHLICYSCLYGAPTLEDMQTHVKSVPHRVCVRTRATAGTRNLVICELCALVFKRGGGGGAVANHFYSPDHLANVRRIQTGETAVPCQEDETHCFVCGAGDEDPDTHSKTDDHVRNAASADAYLKYCVEKSMDPVSCRHSPELKGFFHDVLGKSSPEEIDRAFGVVERIHVGSGSIRNDPFLTRTVDNLKKVQTLPHLQSLVAGSGASTSSPSPTSSTKQVVPGGELSAPSPSPSSSSTKQIVSSEPSSYLGTLTKKEDVDKVTRCSVCNLRFNHATYMLLHLLHIHGKDPLKIIAKEAKGKKAVNCHKCIGKCASPLIYALHHDRHNVDKFIQCPVCDKKYISPQSFYMTDSCKKNSVPAAVKTSVEKVIARVVQRSKGVIGKLREEDDEEDEEEEEEKGEEKSDVVDSDDDIIPKKTSGAKRKFVLDSDSDSDSESGKVPLEDRSVDAMLARYPMLKGPYPKLVLKKRLKYLADGAQKEGGKIDVAEEDRVIEDAKRKEREEKSRKRAAAAAESQSESKRAKMTAASSSSSSATDAPKVERRKQLRADALIMQQGLLDAAASSSSSQDSPSNSRRAAKPGPSSKTRPQAPPPLNATPKTPLVQAKEDAKVTKPTKETPRPKTPVPPTKEASKRVASPKQAPDRHDSATSSHKTSTSSSSSAPSPTKKNRSGPACSKKSSASEKRRKADDTYFCLDCEGCDKDDCDHTRHRRKIIGDADAVAVHKSSGHRRFQTLSAFLENREGRVGMPDLAYDKRYGNKIRKQFKKLCLAGTIECRDYDRERRCKVCRSSFRTRHVVEMFRHLREVHLGGEKD